MTSSIIATNKGTYFLLLHMLLSLYTLFSVINALYDTTSGF